MTISHAAHRSHSLAYKRKASIQAVDPLSAALPVELRIEIFRQFCGQYCPIDKNTVGPLLLLRVCRAWNELVLQTPHLWSSFAVDFRHPIASPNVGLRLIDTVQLWIHRSRSLPLSFTLHYPILDATCTALIQTIVHVSTRWQEATLHAPSASLLPLWEGSPEKFLALRTLTVETVGLSPFSLSQLGVNWAQLVRLDLFLITIPALDECLHILRESVNLRSCSMNTVCVLGTGDLDAVFLPKLEDLRLKLYSGDHAGSQRPPDIQFFAFLGALEVPNLRTLALSWNISRGLHEIPRWNVIDGFTIFLERLRHLEALRLAYIPLSTRQALDCLQLVPALMHLEVVLSQADRAHDFIDNDFLNALTLKTNGSGLLRQLESVRFESHGESFSNTVLLRLIASRWKYRRQTPAGGSLIRVELCSSKRRAVYTPRSFSDLHEGRLDVAASLKSEVDLVEVLRTFMDKNSACFLNSDFPPNIRSLLVFS